MIGGRKRELPNSVYRWDPSGRLDVVVTEAQLPDPNGLCFSPDYKRLYVISTGKGPGDTGAGGGGNVFAFDVDGGKVGGMRPFTDMTVDGVKCGQSVDKFERGAGLCGRDRVWGRRETAWPHPAAGGVRQPDVRGAEAEHAVHVREPVALPASGADAGGSAGLASVLVRRRGRRGLADGAGVCG